MRASRVVLAGGLIAVLSAACQLIVGIGESDPLGEEAGGAPPAPPPLDAIPDATHEAGRIDPIVSLSAGVLHACAVTASGEVYCWGANTYGQCGVGDAGNVLLVDKTPSRPTPERVEGLVGIRMKSVVTTYAGTCALSEDGFVSCWGLNQFGIFGGLEPKASAAPILVTNLPPVDLLVAGATSICARAASGGHAWCWGRNGEGENGRPQDVVDGSAVGEPTPVELPAVGEIGDLAAAFFGNTFCARDTSSTVRCWGSNANGLLGHDPGDAGDAPCLANDVPPGTQCNPAATEVQGTFGGATVLGSFAAWASVDAGTWRAWGANAYGEFGAGQPDAASATPVDVPTLDGFVRIRAGFLHAAGIRADGTLYTWGANAFAEIGTTDTQICIDFPCHPSLFRVDTIPPVKDVSLGYYFTLALDRDGHVWSWGRNVTGTLGHAPTAPELLAGDCMNRAACTAKPTRIVFPFE